MVKQCSNCKENKSATREFFYLMRGKPNGWCIKCHKSRRATDYKKQYHARLRMMALVNYSAEIPFCACCGEETLQFLSIDHIDGGGSKHRKQMKRDGTHTYHWLRHQNYPEGFQVLCHNCNLAKGYYGQCPHQIKL